MTVVPCIVVNQCGPVAHAGDLVAVVPPRHDSCLVVSVLPQPVVRLAEIVQNVARSAAAAKITRSTYFG